MRGLANPGMLTPRVPPGERVTGIAGKGISI
jgi:hypothetical protein